MYLRIVSIFLGGILSLVFAANVFLWFAGAVSLAYLPLQALGLFALGYLSELGKHREREDQRVRREGVRRRSRQAREHAGDQANG